MKRYILLAVLFNIIFGFSFRDINLKSDHLDSLNEVNIPPINDDGPRREKPKRPRP